jgi:hypothetical protein
MTTELLNKILSYLGTRPYVEVADLINEIIKLNQPQEEVTEEKNKK